ncbi:RimJ/RimL family protein N-acetyltransferase [Streptomyces sp. 3211.6]|uniref:GNAT family N-acetyltransferase n=1 Tax=Streptomyces TaxID=1883 RepID=UPI0009A47367|nr:MULTISPECIES: GNAT family N-acetyltransferase [Streptomyces]RKT06243.1 RimJ/RimL family protein N-acetyltransferase [Streptomyces sp. 3211.6]
MTTSPTTRPPLPAVQLRVPIDEDAHAWHRVFDDADVMEFLGGPAELSAYEEFTARQRMHDAQLGYCLWTLLDEDGEVIGFTGAQPWPAAKAWGPVGRIEIGWRLGRSAWGKGYAYAAALATVERLRGLGVEGVCAVIDAGNVRSVAVAERLGMTPGEEFTTPSGRRAVCHELALG